MMLLYKYYYNENGFLIKVDTYDNNSDECGVSFSYIWNGDVLVARVLSDYESGETIVSKVIYDSEGEAVGTVIMLKTNEGIFTTQVLLYRKNLQGDVTGLIDSVSGQLVAAYTYDAYGMIIPHQISDNQFSVIGSVMLLMALPQAYRGYTFSFVGDELCYYLGSRFYSPRHGRFINADKHFDTETGVLGTNMYAYCNNNPVMFTDPTGESYADTIEQDQPLGIFEVVLAFVSAILLLFSSEHTKNKRPSTYDKHSKPRPGRATEKKKQSPSWKKNR